MESVNYKSVIFYSTSSWKYDKTIDIALTRLLIGPYRLPRLLEIVVSVADTKIMDQRELCTMNYLVPFTVLAGMVLIISFI